MNKIIIAEEGINTNRLHYIFRGKNPQVVKDSDIKSIDINRKVIIISGTNIDEEELVKIAEKSSEDVAIIDARTEDIIC